MMSHPSLEPSFAIAQVFAHPGIGWIELCERGVHKRVTAGRDRDQLEYLRGWCAAIQGEIDLACDKLTPLLGSTVLGLGSAARADLATILASSGDAERAERYLNRHKIRDVPLLDMLAASYIELGTPRDAYAINQRAQAVDDHASAATQCRRLVKQIVLGDDADRIVAGKQLEQYAYRSSVDATCTALARAMRCWLEPGFSCMAHFQDSGTNGRYAMAIDLYRNWPRAGTLSEWIAYGERVTRLLPLRGVEPLAIAAFTAALDDAGWCTPSLRSAVHQLASVKPAEPDVARLVAACPGELTVPGPAGPAATSPGRLPAFKKLVQ
jgi:hypothetical protein